MSMDRAGKGLPACDGRRTGTNTPMPGLFSRFEGARQMDRAGAKGAQSWHRSSAHRGGGVKGLMDPIQSPLGSPPRNFYCALEVRGTSLPLLIWEPWVLQTVSNLPKWCETLGPSVYVWRCPFDLPGSWPWGTPSPLALCTPPQPCF